LDCRDQEYLDILREELIPAMGCTEPIALAYAAAKAREVLARIPERMVVRVSGNILKNVKSVVVPHTGGRRGILIAVAAGAAAGNASAELEVLSHMTEEDVASSVKLMETMDVQVECLDGDEVFDIQISAQAGDDESYVRIAGHHTNVICIRRNGETILDLPYSQDDSSQTDRSRLSISGIIEFAEKVDVELLRPILDPQINCNMAICEEGLQHEYGANIGKTLLTYFNTPYIKLRAWAAAGSDARMNGCEMPVVINSGSGNQGITASVPVIVWARENGCSEEDLLRALCVSNLVTIHLKTGIGVLSAYCGAVSAGVGAAAGIAFMKGGRYDMIAHTIVNGLAVNSGIVCDGAKASCAAKVSSAVDAGLLGLAMYENGGNQFYGGDGLVKKGVENTIRIIGCLAKDGMAETDREILRLMMEEPEIP